MIHLIETKDIPKELVINSQKIMMIVFYSEECIPSQMLLPILQELDKKFESLEVYRINIENEEEYILVNDIKSTPTIVLYKDKQAIEKIVGLTSFDKLSKLIEEC